MEWTIIILYKANAQFFAHYEEHRSLNFIEPPRNNKPHTYILSLFPLDAFAR